MYFKTDIPFANLLACLAILRPCAPFIAAVAALAERPACPIPGTAKINIEPIASANFPPIPSSWPIYSLASFRSLIISPSSLSIASSKPTASVAASANAKIPWPANIAVCPIPLLTPRTAVVKGLLLSGVFSSGISTSSSLYWLSKPLI